MYTERPETRIVFTTNETYPRTELRVNEYISFSDPMGFDKNSYLGYWP